MSLYPANGVLAANIKVAFVEMVDETNGYVLAVLKQISFWKPGLHYKEVADKPMMTFTNASFAALYPKVSITKTSLKRGSYDATRDRWTYPPASLTKMTADQSTIL